MTRGAIIKKHILSQMEVHIVDQGPNYDWTTLWSMLPEKAQANLVNPATKAIGDGIGGIFTWIFHKPIEYSAIESAKVESLKHMTAEKISKIPQDKMTLDKRGLMIKVLEDSRYSLDSELMREYFSTLLAKAANKDTADKISPYFSTLLSNLSSDDAKFLKLFKKYYEEAPGWTFTPPYYIADGLPIGRIAYFDKAKPFHYVISEADLLFNTTDNIKSYSKEIDGLESFGLMKRDYERYDPRYIKQFEKMEKLSDLDYKIKALKGEIPNHIVVTTNGDQPFNDASLQRGMLNLTEMGKAFLNIILM